MHITIASIGKLKNPALKSLYAEYNKRLEWKVNLTEFDAKPSIEQEGACLLNAIPPSTFLITLDENGENLKSEEFATCLKNIQLYHQGKLGLIVGGASGLSKEVKEKSQKSISFGRMTWPHLFVRVMLIEQLYRAQQILKGHPYHRG
ncbi:MAG: 23S rRNA (pseudouridine(1915)-N(3))-methyltransferase RlmH [Alphaproteobacteria bacterium]|nr:23S rRNA (pseudouridine(1915)-N(3))-methyltransferase RlmH [Alphaproteobacteria bacterium]